MHTDWTIEDLVDQGLSSVQLEGCLYVGLGLGDALSAAGAASGFALVPLGSSAAMSGGPVTESFQPSIPPVLTGCGASRFKLSLSAGTSPAVGVNEEPLTYLNQGQAYEVKMAYCLAEMENPRLFRSVFCVSFHDRRMQFMEADHLEYWRQSRPGERILDADGPLSYNLHSLRLLPGRINAVEVVWEGGGEG